MDPLRIMKAMKPCSGKIPIRTKYHLLFLRFLGPPFLEIMNPNLMTLAQRQNLKHHFCQTPTFVTRILISLLISIHIT